MFLGTLLINPVLPIWLMLVLTLVGAVLIFNSLRFCGLSLKNQLILFSLRLAGIAIIFFLMLQPEWRKITTKKQKPVLAVAIDSSASMEDKVQGQDKTRADKVKQIITNKEFSFLEDDWELKYFNFGKDASRLVDINQIFFNEARTDIANSVNTIVENANLKQNDVIVMLSDGLDNAGAILKAETASIPVYIPVLEKKSAKQEILPEVEIFDAVYPTGMVVNWKATMDVLVKRNGVAEEQVPVDLKLNGSVIRSTQAYFSKNETMSQVSFALEPDQIGQFVYEIVIKPKNDTRKDNNIRECLIDVTDPENRVLYLEGPARWEFKFLKRALLSEKNFKLSAFVQGADGAFISFNETQSESVTTLPEFNEENLKKYKVIVLGNLKGSSFNDKQWKALKDFVDNGGGLLIMGGKDVLGENGLVTDSILGKIMPVQMLPDSRMNEGRFSLVLTAAGRMHPATAALLNATSIPPVLSYWGPVKKLEFASVLIEGADGSPVFSVRRFGQGKTAILLSDSLWKWQLSHRRSNSEKGIYENFITQVVDWLSPVSKNLTKNDSLQLITRSNEVDVAEMVRIGAVCSDENIQVSCTITGPDGKVVNFPMVKNKLGTEYGLTTPEQGHSCTFTPEKTGKYKIKATTSDGRLNDDMLILVSKPEWEITGKNINAEYLQKLADETGGELFPLAQFAKKLKSIPCQTDEVKVVQEFSLWNNWFWLSLLIILFSVEWFWRRKVDVV